MNLTKDDLNAIEQIVKKVLADYLSGGADESLKASKGGVRVGTTTTPNNR